MTFPAVWLEHRNWCWDQATVDGVLVSAGAEHVVGFEALPESERGAVVVLPARYYADRAKWLNNQLGNLEWTVVFATSDEESTFPPGALRHPNMRLWTQIPRPGIHRPDGDRYMGFGPPPDTA